MKKLLALLFLMMAAGWAVYVFGYSRSADANLNPDVRYQPDPQLHAFAQKIETLRTRMRQQLDLIDHSEKKQAAAPAPSLPSKPLRDPFSSGS